MSIHASSRLPIHAAASLCCGWESPRPGPPREFGHFWSSAAEKADHDCILRVYWDGEPSFSLESPEGGFFANAHSLRYPVISLKLNENPSGGFNPYWPMPLREARFPR